MAAHRGRWALCEALISLKADVDGRAHDASTPLHLAAEGGSEGVALALLAAGADPCLTTVPGGCTAYALAARRGAGGGGCLAGVLR